MSMSTKTFFKKDIYGFMMILIRFFFIRRDSTYKRLNLNFYQVKLKLIAIKTKSINIMCLFRVIL